MHHLTTYYKVNIVWDYFTLYCNWFNTVFTPHGHMTHYVATYTVTYHSILQYVILQFIALYYNILSIHCVMLQCITMCYNICYHITIYHKYVSVYCDTLPCATVWYISLSYLTAHDITFLLHERIHTWAYEYTHAVTCMRSASVEIMSKLVNVCV